MHIYRCMDKDVLPPLDPATLPDDPALLKRLLAERDAEIQRVRQEAAEQLASQAARHQEEMKAAITALLRRYYGAKNERFDPRQLLLFGQRIEQQPLDESSVAQEAGETLVTRRIGKKHKHG